MKQLKKITPLLMTLALIGTMTLTAFAVGGNQMSSLTVTVKKDNQILPGGSIKLSQIASLTEDTSANSYVYTEAFAASGVPLSNVQAENLTPEKAVVWSTYAEQRNVPGTELEVGEDGTASASELKPGLYLIQQGTAAQGYVMSGTVVPLPLQEEDGSMNYIVEAVPKVVEKTPSDEPGSGSGSGSGSGTAGGGSNTGGSSKLPQTGQLWWPVGLLAISGILMYSFGWNCNRKSES